MGKVATKVKEVVKKATAPKVKSVAKKEVVDCTACEGRGLLDSENLCTICDGSGKV